jgi:hypothetical protein
LLIPQKLYEVTRRLKTREEVEQIFLGFMAFTDCSVEQPIPRPKNNTLLFWKEKNIPSKTYTLQTRKV